jgi:phosphoribosylformylglycinamidine cyclo-ligase
MHRTFNMGTGFVAAVAPEGAGSLAAATDGRVIGRVERVESECETDRIHVRGLELHG